MRRLTRLEHSVRLAVLGMAGQPSFLSGGLYNWLSRFEGALAAVGTCLADSR